MTHVTEYMISTNSVLDMEYIEELATPLFPPKFTYTPYKRVVEMASGEARAFGRPEVTWEYGFITHAQREMFRAYCPGVSAILYIRSRITDQADGYKNFKVVMYWPKETREMQGLRTNFSIRFRILEEIVV